MAYPDKTNNTVDPISWPGHLLLSSFEIEIARQFRLNEEKIILAFDDFTPPALDTRSFNVIWGPNYPSIEFPGPVSPMSINMTLTTFYERDIWEFFVQWREDALIDNINNRHDGCIIGYDEERTVQYKANLYSMWCKRIELTRAQRSDARHTINVDLFVYDYIHDFEYKKQRTIENIIA